MARRDGVLGDEIERAELAEIGEHELIGGHGQQHTGALAAIVDVDDQATIAASQRPHKLVGRVRRAAKGPKNEDAGLLPGVGIALERQVPIARTRQVAARDQDIGLTELGQARRQSPQLLQVALVRHHRPPSRGDASSPSVRLSHNPFRAVLVWQMQDDARFTIRAN
jgi:hypothetical protein